MSQIPLFPTRSGSGRGLIEWHPAGQRIIKTSLAVTITLFFYMFLGYKGENMQAEAAITAIICMQPYVHGSTENAANRLGGTIIGACWGFLFLMLCPLLGKNRPLLYLFMGLGTLITLHSTVLLRVPDTAELAAIVFICVVIAYPDIENPLDQAFHRILGVLVGNTVAIAINTVRLPRRRHPEKLFFIHMDSLTESQLSRMAPPVRFRLQRLYQDGAKICLMSSHAPAFNASEDYTVPMIVMDGAAIFDARENTYLSTTPLNPASCRWLVKALEDSNYFIYTVHKDRNCIYHHGALTERERTVYQHLRRSPYRYYLDDDHYAVADVVYIKIVTTKDEAERIQRRVQPMLEKMKLRSVIRRQAGLEDGYSLYFYAVHADLEHAQAHLMRIIPSEERVVPAEHDPIRLLRKVKNEYEPDVVTAWVKKRLGA